MGEALCAHLADGTTGVGSATAAGALPRHRALRFERPRALPPACCALLCGLLAQQGLWAKARPGAPHSRQPRPSPPAPGGIWNLPGETSARSPVTAETSSPGAAWWPGSRRVWQLCPRVSDPSSCWRCRVLLGASGMEGHGAQGAGDRHGCAGSSPLGTSVLSRSQRWPCWADLEPKCWRPLRSHSRAPCTWGHLDRSSLPFGQGKGRSVRVEERHPQRRAQGTSQSPHQARGRVGRGRLCKRAFHFTCVARSCCHQDT